MDRMTIGYDDNLGLPSDFATIIGCAIKPYHNLDGMLIDFEKGNLAAIFIPAGTLPYLNNFKIIAQSIFSPQNKTTLRSNFVSKKKFDLSEIPELTLGRVNQYCTTSFWAPLIYLKDVLKAGTKLTFENTKGFPDMLHKTAEGILDCSMVWDIIMQQHPNDTKEVHELFYKDNLPSPIIISKSDTDIASLNQLTHFSSQDHASFFHGFKAPDMEAINQFVSDMEQVSRYFKVHELETT